MDKNGDKIMSVKNEMDMFFEKFLKKYEETAVGLPRCPKRKNIDQTIYIGETDSEGYSKWKPIPYGRDESFLRLLEIYGIEKNEDIVEYFSTYNFLRIDIKFKNYLISINSVEPKDEYKSLRRKIDAYTDSNGKITHIPIGVEQQKANYNVVVEVKTGVVKFADDEKGKMRKIAPSLEEFIKGWEPWV